MTRLSTKHSSSRFAIYFLFQNKIETDMYVFLYNTIRYFSYKLGYRLYFCDNSLHDNVYYDEYSHCFFALRAFEQLFFNEYMEKAVRAYHIVHHFQNHTANLRPCR